MKFRIFSIAGAAAAIIFLASPAWNAEGKKTTLLNVSYDPTRGLYEEVNSVFSAQWKEKTGQEIEIRQSHGGSGKQARAVIDGLDADVVTLALAYDIDALHEKGGLIPKDWQSRFPHNSAPYTSTIVFVVRKGNPKGIKDWDDLAREGVSVVTPNPKTSGGARWNYLAAWGYAKRKFAGDESLIKAFVGRIYKNVAVLDTGARGSTTTFAEREIGDVFISWENEALLVQKELGPEKFVIVYPSVSILAEPPVTIVDTVVKKNGTQEAAKAYLDFLYTEEGQEIIGKHYFRPRSEAALKKYEAHLPKIELFTIDKEFGGWQKAQKDHFNDGGIFDSIYQS